MSLKGGVLYVEPSDSVYHINGGIILKKNVSLIGANAATPRGTSHATKPQPVEHCFAYPLSGEFIRIDYCYDIPRILHCHVNPAITRKFAGGYSKEIIDAVIAKKTFAYSINDTDNAQLIDVFSFGTYGGIYLGGEPTVNLPILILTVLQ